jgi:hypothetical protein
MILRAIGLHNPESSYLSVDGRLIFNTIISESTKDQSAMTNATTAEATVGLDHKKSRAPNRPATSRL